MFESVGPNDLATRNLSLSRRSRRSRSGKTPSNCQRHKATSDRRTNVGRDLTETSAVVSSADAMCAATHSYASVRPAHRHTSSWTTHRHTTAGASRSDSANELDIRRRREAMRRQRNGGGPLQT